MSVSESCLISTYQRSHLGWELALVWIFTVPKDLCTKGFGSSTELLGYSGHFDRWDLAGGFQLSRDPFLPFSLQIPAIR